MPSHDAPCWSCRAGGFEVCAWGRTETVYKGCCASCFKDRTCHHCRQFLKRKGAAWCGACEQRLAMWCRRCEDPETLRLKHCARCISKQPPAKCWGCLAHGRGDHSKKAQTAKAYCGCCKACFRERKCRTCTAFCKDASPMPVCTVNACRRSALWCKQCVSPMILEQNKCWECVSCRFCARRKPERPSNFHGYCRDCFEAGQCFRCGAQHPGIVGPRCSCPECPWNQKWLPFGVLWCPCLPKFYTTPSYCNFCMEGLRHRFNQSSECEMPAVEQLPFRRRLRRKVAPALENWRCVWPALDVEPEQCLLNRSASGNHEPIPHWILAPNYRHQAAMLASLKGLFGIGAAAIARKADDSPNPERVLASTRRLVVGS